MQPNTPLNTEEKIELEMDKVIEAEQKPIIMKNRYKIAIIVFIIATIASFIPWLNLYIYVPGLLFLRLIISIFPINITDDTVFSVLAFILAILLWTLLGLLLGWREEKQIK